MSDNKCPCCGCPMKETYLGFVCPADNCAFRCSTNSLSRIAAAMEFYEADNGLGGNVTFEDYAALLTRHNALVEAVKKMLDVECGANEPYCLGDYTSARAEVSALIGEGRSDVKI